MKLINYIVFYFFIFVVIVSLYAFIKICFDSLDLDRMYDVSISRSTFLNSYIPYIIYPAVILSSTLYLQHVYQIFKNIRKENRYTKTLMFLFPLTWWIPVVHFFGSFNSLKTINYYAEESLQKKELRKLKSGSRWLNVGFILFYSLVLIALWFNYMNNNKDSYDFFLNVLFLHIVAIGIGMVKISGSLIPFFKLPNDHFPDRSEK